jgi:hypothetical protein
MSNRRQAIEHPSIIGYEVLEESIPGCWTPIDDIAYKSLLTMVGDEVYLLPDNQFLFQEESIFQVRYLCYDGEYFSITQESKSYYLSRLTDSGIWGVNDLMKTITDSMKNHEINALDAHNIIMGMKEL